MIDIMEFGADQCAIRPRRSFEQQTMEPSLLESQSQELDAAELAPTRLSM